MSQVAWRAPTPAESHLVTSWLSAWNIATGDNAVLGLDALARRSCRCGTCPSFTITPLLLTTESTVGGPLPIEGHGSRPRGGVAAGLLAWTIEDGIDFEIYPLADEVLVLDDLTFRFVSTA